MKKLKYLSLAIALAITVVGLSGCSTAPVASDVNNSNSSGEAQDTEGMYLQVD